MISWFLTFIVLALLIQDVLLVIFLKKNFSNFDHKRSFKDSYPKVSVVIAYRNEEVNLKKHLQSLELLDYPQGSLQIILGDDGSEDETGRILQSWSNQFTYTDCYSLEKPASFKGNGKAWALQELCLHASGELLLFTDADCEIPPYWIKSMVEASLTTGAAMVTGVTQVERDSIFASMQSLDWWLNLGMVKVVSDLGTNITSMGNNMLIRKDYYIESGGFQQTFHSLTEDFEMARRIQKLGGNHIHLVSSANLITTKPVSTFEGLLQQRKRWMRGAMGLPLYWKILLGLQVIFFPAVVALVFLSFWKGIILWLCKLIVQSIFLAFFASKAGQKIKIRHLCFYEFYYFFTAWCTIVYYFWPGKTVWKGRKYA